MLACRATASTATDLHSDVQVIGIRCIHVCVNPEVCATAVLCSRRLWMRAPRLRRGLQRGLRVRAPVPRLRYRLRALRLRRRLPLTHAHDLRVIAVADGLAATLVVLPAASGGEIASTVLGTAAGCH